MNTASVPGVDCERVAGLLASLVRVPTPNDPERGLTPGPREASEILDLVRAATGDHYEVLDGAPSPVILRVAGSGRPVTLFLAHYDVVPPGPGWSVDPYSGVVRDGALYGRGAADDKSNIAAISMGLRGFAPERGTIVVAFTGDEETGGRSAAWLAGWLEEEGLWPDYLVNGDGSLERIITRRRSAYTARVEVEARAGEAVGEPYNRVFETRFLLRKTMHSAYFTPGIDTHALIAASLWARDNEALVSGLEGEWVKTNVVPRSARLTGVLPGGGGPVRVDHGLTGLVWSIVPLARAPVNAELYSDYGVTVNPNVYRRGAGTHTLMLDIRAMTGERSRIEYALSYVLDNTLGPGRYRLHVRGRGGYLYTPPAARIVSLAARAARALGLPERPVEAGGASDSRHFSPRGVEAIDYGPLGYNIHGPDEHVLLDSLCRATSFYTLLARLIHGRAEG